MGIEDQSKSKEIDGHVYLVRPLMATAANKLLVRLGKLIAPAVGGAGMKMDEEIHYLAAIEKLFSNATPEEIDSILKELAKQSEVDNKPLLPLYDLHFMGKLMTMYKWAAFALEVNYADFFGGFGSLENVVALAKASVSKRPNISSGPSGGSSQSA